MITGHYKPIVYWNGRQAVCNCGVYNFPHRLGGGACNGHFMAKDCYENCRSCNGCEFIGPYGCEVITEVTKPKHCPFVADFLAEYQIKIK